MMFTHLSSCFWMKFLGDHFLVIEISKRLKKHDKMRKEIIDMSVKKLD